MQAPCERRASSKEIASTGLFIGSVNNQRSQVSLPFGAEPCLPRPVPASGSEGEQALGGQGMFRAPWSTCPAPPPPWGFPQSSCASCAFCRGGCWIRPQHLILFSFQFHKCSLGPTLGLPWELKPWPQSQVDLGLNPAAPLASVALGQTSSPLWLSVSLSVKWGAGGGVRMLASEGCYENETRGQGVRPMTSVHQCS